MEHSRSHWLKTCQRIRARLGTGRKVKLAAIALALTGVSGLTSAHLVAAAAPGSWQYCDPSTDTLCRPLQITPNSGLTDGQLVHVLSTGNVLPSTIYQVAECKGVSGVQQYPATDCDPSTVVTVTTPPTTNPDGSGTLSTVFTVHENITVSATAINCFFTPCVIAVLDVPQYNPISFSSNSGPPPPPIFAPGGGSFTIGDLESVSGTHVTFWGAQWAKANPTSGGSTAASFKGFAEFPSIPNCNINWNTDPGNSAPPPNGPLPPMMGVIVTSHYSQSGSMISGNTLHIVIVQTDPGYQPDAGHPGTGTVVGQVC
jgi:hypothetical protein